MGLSLLVEALVLWLDVPEPESREDGCNSPVCVFELLVQPLVCGLRLLLELDVFLALLSDSPQRRVVVV